MKLSFRKLLYPVLMTLTILFIFYNSIQDAEASSNASTTVLNFVNKLINIIGLNFKIEGYFLRKLAHFIEFFIFGTFLMFNFEVFMKKTFKAIGFPMFFAIFIPVLDEYIQIFSIGRNSSVIDVLLDFTGALTGILYVCLWTFIKNKCRKKYKNKYQENM